MHKTPRSTREALGEEQHATQAGSPIQDLFVRQGSATATQRDRLAVPFAAPFAAVGQIAGESFVPVAGSLARLNRRPGKPKPDLPRNLPAKSLSTLQAPVLQGLSVRLS